jgi:hypothetical protein
MGVPSAPQRLTGAPLPPVGISYLTRPSARPSTRPNTKQDTRTNYWPDRPQLVERAARAWWSAVGCWFLGAALGQMLHSPAAWAFTIGGAWSLPGPLAIVVFGAVAVFLASLVFPMRDGAQWARLLLTVFAFPAEVVLLRQIGASLLTVPATVGGVAQGVLSMIGLCVVPGAVSMMYRRSTHGYFHGAG